MLFAYSSMYIQQVNDISMHFNLRLITFITKLHLINKLLFHHYLNTFTCKLNFQNEFFDIDIAPKIAITHISDVFEYIESTFHSGQMK